MIRTFADRETELIFSGTKSRKFPPEIQNSARRKLRMIYAAKTVDDLRIPPGNRLEKLSGNLDGYFSVRINDQWRIVFRFEDGGAEDVGIQDYHR